MKIVFNTKIYCININLLISCYSPIENFFSLLAFCLSSWGAAFGKQVMLWFNTTIFNDFWFLDSFFVFHFKCFWLLYPNPNSDHTNTIKQPFWFLALSYFCFIEVVGKNVLYTFLVHFCFPCMQHRAVVTITACTSLPGSRKGRIKKCCIFFNLMLLFWSGEGVM